MSPKSDWLQRRIATTARWINSRRRQIALGRALLRRLRKIERNPVLPQLAVLLVEDDYLIVRHIERVLASHECEAAGRGARVKDVLRIIDHKQIDLAFLDVHLRDGEKVYPVADELRRRGIPFAFISAFGPDRVEAGYRDEAFIGKPILEQDICRFVDSVRGRAPVH